MSEIFCRLTDGPGARPASGHDRLPGFAILLAGAVAMGPPVRRNWDIEDRVAPAGPALARASPGLTGPGPGRAGITLTSGLALKHASVSLACCSVVVGCCARRCCRTPSHLAGPRPAMPA